MLFHPACLQGCTRVRLAVTGSLTGLSHTVVVSLLVALCSTLLYGLPMQATASEPAEDAPVKIRITGSRAQLDTHTAPVGALVIDADDLKRSTADNLAELLDDVGGIHGRRLYGINGSQTEIDLLGFGVTGTQNTLLLLNGRKLNDIDLAAVDFTAIPLAAIERIEILPGSGSVLYGNGASGGSINIITREQYSTHAGVQLGVGEFSTQEAGLWGTAQQGPVSVATAVQGTDSDGYMDNNRLHQRSAFIDLRVRHDALTAYLTSTADRQRLRLPGARTVNIPAGINEFETDRTGAQTPNNWADQEGYYLMPGLALAVTPELTLVLDATQRAKEQTSYYDFGGGSTYFSDTRLHTQGLHPRVEWFIDTARPQEITLGWDYYHSEYRSDRALNPFTIQQPIHQIEIDQKQRSWYLQNKVHLTDSTVLTLGGRHEWVTVEALDIFNPAAPVPPFFFDQAAEPFRKTNEEETLQIGIRQFIGHHLSVFANLEKNTRFATVDEIFEADPNQFFVSSLDPLKPQTGDIGTLGVQWKSRKVDSTLSVYRGHYRNEIYYDPASFENINLEPTKRYGVTLNSRWAATDWFAVILNGAFQRARIRDGQFQGNEVPMVPRQSGYAALEWKPFPSWTLQLSQRYVGKKYFDNDKANSFGQRVPSYRWSNLVSRWQQEGAWVSLSIENLTDEKVFDYGVCSGSFTPDYTQTCNLGVYNGYPLPDKHAMLRVGIEY